MPELPEVETIRRSLSLHVLDLKIEDIIIRWSGAVTGYLGYDFKEYVKGRTLKSIERRGKYLLITLDDGWSLIAHMRMTGRLNYYPHCNEPEKHTHVVFKLSKGEIHFTDTRKFGRLQLVRTEERLNQPSLKRLGPEPLGEEFSPEELGQRLAPRKLPLKCALLDQTVVAGLGNIYADESLFRAGLSPERVANSLSSEELRRLYISICEVLQEGINANGTSFRDYRDANGDRGAFQRELRVYGRGGEACMQCGRPLAKKRMGGRTTVFCSNCQR
jgi:formamidopyrimidine-DNA glycosylase